MEALTAPLADGGMYLLLLWPCVLLLGGFLAATRIRRTYRRAQASIAEVDSMTGPMFTRYLEVVFQQLGYRVQRVEATGAHAADLIIINHGVRTIVCAAHGNASVGAKQIHAAVAVRTSYGNARTLVISNRSYTKHAKQLARANGVKLWNRDRLVDALLTAKQQPVARAKRGESRA